MEDTLVTCVCLFVLALSQAPASPPALMAEVRVLLDAPQTPERMQRIEALLTELRRLEDFRPDKRILDTRFGLHTEMLERYRASGDLVSLRRHAEWLVAFEHLAHAFHRTEALDDNEQRAEQAPLDLLRAIRKRHGAAFLAARLDVARAALADGDRAKAIWWLDTGEKCLGDISGAVRALRTERDRLRKGAKSPD
jgi:hypothetical protein